MNAPQSQKHRSLEKTDSLEYKSSVPGDDASSSSEESLTDTQLLKNALELKTNEAEVFGRSLRQLETAFAALRSDFASQKAEHLSELKMLNEVVALANSEAQLGKESLKQERHSNRQLKSQNLSLQYLLNQWGIPVETGNGGTAALEAFEEGLERFFPRLTCNPGASDPIPPVLRGELSSFCFPDVLHFISNSSLQGVLTVVSDRIVCKLFLEKGALRCAGWNNRDPELSLARLLGESQLVPVSTLAGLAKRADFDLELATILHSENKVPAETIRSGLKEHARVILGFLFHLRSGSFFFQLGQIERKKDLEFRLTVTDVLLKTAAEMDERTKRVNV